MSFFQPKSVGFLLLAVCVAAFAAACSRHAGLPDVESKQYAELCAAFYTGLASLQSGEDVRAQEELTRATQIAPGEPAGWADLGILQIRQQQLDAALASVEKARLLAPGNSRIEALLGSIDSRIGKVPEALTHFQKSISLDSHNLKALYSLADETERQALPTSDADAQQLLNRILKIQPGNLAVWLDVARLSAKRGDAAQLNQAVNSMRQFAETWPDRAKQQFSAIEQEAAGPNPRAAAVKVQFLRNVLLRDPGYRRSLDQVKVPTAFVAEPFVKFLRLPSPHSDPAAPDVKLQFASEPLAGTPPENVKWAGAIALNEQSDPAIIWADAAGVHIPGGAILPLPRTKDSTAGASLGNKAVAGADLNYDFKTDLIVATSGGVRIYQQVDPQHFKDVTSETKLPPAVLNGSYTGAWAFDVDLDGDLDIVLGVPQGEPTVLRNNGDGSYTPIHPFHGVDGLVAFSAADIDGDGDPDVAVIDKNGRLTVFMNERLGNYRKREAPSAFSEPNLDVAAADVNGDGLVDFVVLRKDLSIARLSGKESDEGWDFAELVPAHRNANSMEPVSLLLADLDNNGALDLIAGDQAFLGDGKRFSPLPAKLNANARAVADLNGDGRLDVVGLSPGADGTARAVELVNHGVLNYRWQTIRTKAAHAFGDQRINSFGIGGEIEIRADLLTQKQVISSPVSHFGLGEHTKVNFARIVWPNGSVQAEFALKPGTTVRAGQRLKGSCPFLFTWDGKRIRFVKDTAPWSPALGLHINAQQVAGIYQTQEWFKIPGSELAPHDGYYDLRVTAEYWETFYIDHYSLLVVDHPKGTQVYSDERFAAPPPPLKLYVTKDPRPFACARDERGQDVSSIVGALDGNYLDTFGRGQYQGVTNDHWVELQLPEDAPRTCPVYLIADGWMHPSDGTINVALGQNSAAPPAGLSIEVPDKSGRWVAVRKGLGFPTGRVKTIVLDLSGIFHEGGPRKFRLRTNLEIYWDKLAWAEGVDHKQMRTKRLALSGADLQYRGFSQMTQANLSSPELPDYNVLAGTGQKWRDLEGYYTRFGDVRGLLDRIDDRMVIANAGDELRLKFAAQAPVSEGWTRDYVMIGDGWIKDGDYNSTFSKTVLPLPYHAMKDYTAPPGALEQDPAYRLHPADWQTFQTRYVTPNYFATELWRHP